MIRFLIRLDPCLPKASVLIRVANTQQKIIFGINSGLKIKIKYIPSHIFNKKRKKYYILLMNDLTMYLRFII